MSILLVDINLLTADYWVRRQGSSPFWSVCPLILSFRWIFFVCMCLYLLCHFCTTLFLCDLLPSFYARSCKLIFFPELEELKLVSLIISDVCWLNFDGLLFLSFRWAEFHLLCFCFYLFCHGSCLIRFCLLDLALFQLFGLLIDFYQSILAIIEHCSVFADFVESNPDLNWISRFFITFLLLFKRHHFHRLYDYEQHRFL